MNDTAVGDFAQRYWRSPLQAPPELIDTPEVDDAQFRLLADAIPTLCWIARGDGHIVWYNRRWHDYCGSTPEEMEGWGWRSVHDPAELPRVMEAWTGSVASGEPFEMTFPLRGADGVFRPFLTRVVGLRDARGHLVRWFGVNTEIGAQVRAEHALQASEAKFDALTHAMPQMVWSATPEGAHDGFNARWYDFTGAEPGSTNGDGWRDRVHPDDREPVTTRWRRSVATGDPYEAELRLAHRSGGWRWTLARALPIRDAAGRITRWVGAYTDIDTARRVAEQNELLSRELSHRIKNIFAVIAGLIRLSARRAPAAQTFATELQERIAALGRAHDFARPHSEQSRPEAGPSMLHTMLRDLFSPYEALGEGRIRIDGDDTPIDDRGATPIALVFHELATNAVKYGALSNATGHVHLTTRRVGSDLTMRWDEEGGPPVPGAPATTGFGNRLVEMSIEQQLGGALTRRWPTTGLSVELRAPLTSFVRT